MGLLLWGCFLRKGWCRGLIVFNGFEENFDILKREKINKEQNSFEDDFNTKIYN